MMNPLTTIYQAKWASNVSEQVMDLSGKGVSDTFKVDKVATIFQHAEKEISSFGQNNYYTPGE